MQLIGMIILWSGHYTSGTKVILNACVFEFKSLAVTRIYETLYTGEMHTRGLLVSGNDVERVYTGVVADIAKLARQLAETDAYQSANGPDALLAFADHLEGIVAAVGANQFQTQS